MGEGILKYKDIPMSSGKWSNLHDGKADMELLQGNCQSALHGLSLSKHRLRGETFASVSQDISLVQYYQCPTSS
jgi:hypothetical protein